VKSTAVRDVERSRVAPCGLVDDRRWMVVDGEGELVSARTDEALFKVTTRTRAIDGLDVDLLLSADGHPDLEVAEPSGAPVDLVLHGNRVLGVPAGQHADRWFGQVIGRSDVRLMWCDDISRRRLDPAHSEPHDSTAFADGYPLLVTTQSSLDQLNDWIAETALDIGEPTEALPMKRFRPNLVLAGEAPFAEEGWSRLRIGDLALRAAKPCNRCVMTTVDPATLDRGKEPIRTLARYRKVGSAVPFGMNFIPEGYGEVAVGDPVTFEA
jgi:uncharacterized protein YcbX